MHVRHMTILRWSGTARNIMPYRFEHVHIIGYVKSVFFTLAQVSGRKSEIQRVVSFRSKISRRNHVPALKELTEQSPGTFEGVKGTPYLSLFFSEMMQQFTGWS